MRKQRVSDGHFSDKKVEYLNRNDRKIQLDRNEGLYWDVRTTQNKQNKKSDQNSNFLNTKRLTESEEPHSKWKGANNMLIYPKTKKGVQKDSPVWKEDNFLRLRGLADALVHKTDFKTEDGKNCLLYTSDAADEL